jgi:hypothetical protein
MPLGEGVAHAQRLEVRGLLGEEGGQHALGLPGRGAEIAIAGELLSFFLALSRPRGGLEPHLIPLALSTPRGRRRRGRTVGKLHQRVSGRPTGRAG